MQMYSVVLKSRFRKDYARCARRGWDMSVVDDAMRVLASGQRLPPTFRDHPLKGNMSGCRECHIAPDWLLVYRKIENMLVLEFISTGTHRELGLGG
mgnify:FL=1